MIFDFTGTRRIGTCRCGKMYTRFVGARQFQKACTIVYMRHSVHSVGIVKFSIALLAGFSSCHNCSSLSTRLHYTFPLSKGSFPDLYFFNYVTKLLISYFTHSFKLINFIPEMALKSIFLTMRFHAILSDHFYFLFMIGSCRFSEI